MVYWQDIPADYDFVSPFRNGQDRRFLTIEPDVGGFSNIRMVFEINVVMAVVTGRTLVLPRKREIYHLDVSQNNNKRAAGSFLDFFAPLQNVSNKISALQVMEMDEFLAGEAAGLRLPKHYKSWIDQRHFVEGRHSYYLDEFLRNSTESPYWGSHKCMVVIPKESREDNGRNGTSDDNDGKFVSWMRQVRGTMWERHDEFVGRPVAVDASPQERLQEVVGKREALCVYNANMQLFKYFHMRDELTFKGRILTHWYD